MLHKTFDLYKQAYRGLSVNIWLLSAVMLINRSGTMVLAFMTLYCRHLGFTLSQGGIVVAIYGLGSVSGALIGGKLSDAFGFYRIQFLSLFCGGLLFLVLGQMEDYTSICIFTFILAMVNETFRPANSTAIAYYSTPQNRTQAYSLVRLAVNLGWGIGSALGGLLASINYSLLFWVDGATNISASVLLLIILPAVSLKQQYIPEQAVEKVAGTGVPYRDKVFLYFLFLQLLFAISFFQLFTTIPVYFKDVLRMTEFWIGVVMSLNGVLIALFEMVIVFKLEGRKPYLVLMGYGSILMGVSFLLLTLPAAWGLLIAMACMLVITVAEMVSMPFMNSYYIARTTQLTRGSYAGMYTMTWSLAQVIGSSSGAFIAASVGFEGLWFSVCSICLMAGAGFFILNKKT